MGNTSNYNFPYPDKTSPKTAPADVKALADAIDAKLFGDVRPWWSFVRWTTGALGTGADATMTGWDLQESNFAIGSPSPGGGIVVPRAGLYLVQVDVVFLATWAGAPLISAGAKTTNGREIYVQRNEPNSAGGQRRGYSVTGMLRAVVGETINGFMNQPGGTGTVNFAAGTSPGDRSSSRFSGIWIAA
jgi:hypothetical protein